MKFHHVLFVVAVLFASTAHADILIDSFTDGNPLTVFGVGSSSSSTSASSILGGIRDESLTVRNLNGDEFFGAFGFDGEWSVGQGSTDQIQGSLRYDNFGIVDLTEGGLNSQFAIDFLRSDSNEPIADVLSITAFSGGNSDSQFVTIPSNNNSGVRLVDFSQFNGVDFTQLSAIELNVDFGPDSAGRDFEIGSFEAIPEPSTAALLGLFGATTFLRRRRK